MSDQQASGVWISGRQLPLSSCDQPSSQLPIEALPVTDAKAIGITKRWADGPTQDYCRSVLTEVCAKEVVA